MDIQGHVIGVMVSGETLVFSVLMRDGSIAVLKMHWPKAHFETDGDIIGLQACSEELKRMKAGQN